MPAFTCFSAYAEGKDPIASGYENIFYLSDTDESEYYFDNYLTTFANNYRSFNSTFGDAYFYDINDDSFLHQSGAFSFFNWCKLKTYGVENSLLFFECNSKFYRGFYDELTIEDYRYNLAEYFGELEDYFRELEDNGCTIVLILQYDEHILSGDGYDYSGFLDYVDLHVDFDRLYVLFATLVGEFEEDYNEPFTLFLDSAFSQPWFLQEYIIPHYNACGVYLNGMDQMEILSSGFSDKEIFAYVASDFFSDLRAVKDIQVIITLGDESFMDLSTCTTFSTNENYLEDTIIYDKFAAFGWYGTTQFESWLNSVDSMVNRLGRSATTYVYDCLNSDLAPYFLDNLDLVSCYKGRWYLENFNKYSYLNDVFIVQLMYDALFVEDLSYYNNLIGRCPIYHKAIEMGSDGRLWIEGVAGLGDGDVINVIL